MITPTIPAGFYIALLIAVPVAFASIGGRLAYGRGINWLLWGLLCGLFPVFLLVVWFTKPKKEVAGFFRKCGVCGEWIKWREEPCHYCAYRQEQARRTAGPDPEQESSDRS